MSTREEKLAVLREQAYANIGVKQLSTKVPAYQSRSSHTSYHGELWDPELCDDIDCIDCDQYDECYGCDDDDYDYDDEEECDNEEGDDNEDYCLGDCEHCTSASCAEDNSDDPYHEDIFDCSKQGCTTCSHHSCGKDFDSTPSSLPWTDSSNVAPLPWN